MEPMMNMIKYWCHDFWEIYGDHRISHLPLLKGGPWHVIGLTLVYLYFVKIMGPKMMKDRPPYELRNVMLAHNTFLVLLNGIGFLVGMWGTNWGLDTLKCQPFDPSSPAIENRVLFYLGYTYYISKYIDFLDTVYFVLRKKYSHITPLHVFHHTMMPFWCYIFFKFSSYTNNGFIPLINAFVHTIMYSYYALAALGPHMKPYLWWKKYITQLQLVQFCFATVHSLYMLLDTTCTCSKFLISLQVSHGILFLYLFGNFYKRSYNQNRKSVSPSPAIKSSKGKVSAKVN